MTGGCWIRREASYPLPMDPHSVNGDSMKGEPMDSESIGTRAAGSDVTRVARRTSGWPPTRNEWIGLIVAVVLGVLAVVVLGWFGALR